MNQNRFINKKVLLIAIAAIAICAGWYVYAFAFIIPGTIFSARCANGDLKLIWRHTANGTIGGLSDTVTFRFNGESFYQLDSRLDPNNFIQRVALPTTPDIPSVSFKDIVEKSSGRERQIDIYVDPAKFSKEEFADLSSCVRDNLGAINTRLSRFTAKHGFKNEPTNIRITGMALILRKDYAPL